MYIVVCIYPDPSSGDTYQLTSTVHYMMMLGNVPTEGSHVCRDHIVVEQRV